MFGFGRGSGRRGSLVLGVVCALVLSACGPLYGWGDNQLAQTGTGLTDDNGVPVHPITVPTDTGFQFKTVAAGLVHSCGIGPTGALFCWGSNLNGQLGTGTTAPGSTTPVKVGEDEDWTAISSSGMHSCGIRSGALYCWGDNEFGQLGDGTTTERDVPAQVGLYADWIEVTAGAAHTCGLRNGDDLYCWGSNEEKQLGAENEYPEDNYSPTPVGGSWSMPAAGSSHTCGLELNTGLMCWGLDSRGQVSGQYWLPDPSDCLHRRPECTYSRPTLTWLGEFAGDHLGIDPLSWTAVSAGNARTCAIHPDAGQWGGLYCWGNPLSDAYQFYGSSTRHISSDSWTDVTTAGGHACGIVDGGTAYCWGNNVNGELGTNETSERVTRPTPLIISEGWTDLEAGANGTTLGIRKPDKPAD